MVRRMGNIGRRQQRFEVLPAPAWGIEDVLAEWRRTEPPQRDDAEPVREHAGLIEHAELIEPADNELGSTPRER